MGWRLDKDGAALWDGPLSLEDIACRDEEIAWLEDKKRPWQLIDGLLESDMGRWKGMHDDIWASGAPVAGLGFDALEPAGSAPLPGLYATATILTTEVALWNAASYTPIAANPQCPKVYEIFAFGTSTTAGTQGTMAFNARFGQIITSPLIGASTTTAQTASQTATPWQINGRVVIWKGGIATSGQVVAMFEYKQGTAVSGGSLNMISMNQQFGTTTGAISVVTDGSVAAGLWMGGIAVTSTTNTFIPQSVIWSSKN